MNRNPMYECPKWSLKEYKAAILSFVKGVESSNTLVNNICYYWEHVWLYDMDLLRSE